MVSSSPLSDLSTTEEEVPSFFVKALFDYESSDASSLSFKRGDIIEVYNTLDSGWWDGVIDGERGWLPSNYVAKLQEDELEDLLHQQQQNRSEDRMADNSPSELGHLRHNNHQSSASAAQKISRRYSRDVNGITGDPGYEDPADAWIPQVTAGGHIFYLNTVTGETATDLPVAESPATQSHEHYSSAFRRTVNGKNSTGPANLPAEIDLSTLALDEEEELAPPSRERSLGIEELEDPREIDLRRAREIRDRLAPPEAEGVPVLALKVRQALKTLKEVVNGPPSSSTAPSSSGETLALSISEALEYVVASIRDLVYISGVMDASLPGTSASAGSPSLSSELLQVSHRKVQGSLSRLVFSVRTMEHDQDFDDVTAQLRERVSMDAEDVERVVVAFGLEAERERGGGKSIITGLGISSQSSNPNKKNVRRVRGWFDSLGVAQPLNGRNGFMADADNFELNLYPFTIDASLEVAALISSAESSIEGFNSYDGPIADTLAMQFELVQKISAIQTTTRTFDIAGAIDLDGEDVPPGARDEAYASLVKEANEALNSYEQESDSLADSLGWMITSAGILPDEDFVPTIFRISLLLKPLLKSFSRLATVSQEQNLAVKRGVKGRIGLRRHVPPLPTSRTSTSIKRSSKRLSTDSISRGSIASRKSSLLSSMRGRGAVARGLDEETSEQDDEEAERLREEAEMEARDSVNGGLHRSTASTGSTTLTGNLNRPRGASIGSTSSLLTESVNGSVVSFSNINGRQGAYPNPRINPMRRESDESGHSPQSSKKLRKFFGGNVPAVSPPLPSETPWYLGVGYRVPEDLVFVEGNPSSVKGGTLKALVERLTLHDNLDSNFNHTFLMTYKSFSTSNEVFDALVQRFQIQPPDGLTDDELRDWTINKLKPIRLRVFNIIKAWIEQHLNDSEDKPILDKFLNFAQNMPPEMSLPSKQLIRSIESRQKAGDNFLARKMTLNNSVFPPASIVPRSSKDLKLLDIDPLELARQLTIMDSRIYNKIRPNECLRKAWSDPANQDAAVNIKEIIRFSNKISKWVAIAILAENDVKKRAAVVKHFVYTAERCLNLNNFSTMAAIIAGLNLAPISRLKRTWEAINTKTAAMLEVVDKSLDSSKNFAGYRERLRNILPPCVPFLGVYLTFLTFIEDGNPNYLSGDGRLINFGKRMKSAEIIREIQQYQTAPYNLTQLAPITNFIELQIKDVVARSDEELYKRSCQLEARERDDDRVTRLLGESGFI